MEGGGGRRASSAADFFSRRPSSSFLASVRRYSTSTVFGLKGEEKDLAKEGRRHSSTPVKEGSPRGERWRSLAKVVLGDVGEEGEVRPEEPGEQAGTGRRHILRRISSVSAKMYTGEVW